MSRSRGRVALSFLLLLLLLLLLLSTSSSYAASSSSSSSSSAFRARRDLVALAPPEPRTVAIADDARREVRLLSFGLLLGGKLNATITHYKARQQRTHEEGREEERESERDGTRTRTEEDRDEGGDEEA